MSDTCSSVCVGGGGGGVSTDCTSRLTEAVIRVVQYIAKRYIFKKVIHVYIQARHE